MHKLIGVVLFIVLIFFVMVTSGVGVWIFIDTISLISVFGITFAITYGRHGFREAITFSPPVIDTIINSSLAAGVLGTLIGLVAMLVNISDPSSLGPAMAVAVLSSVYSVIIASSAYVYKKDAENFNIGAAAAIGTCVALITFFVLLLSFSKP